MTSRENQTDRETLEGVDALLNTSPENHGAYWDALVAAWEAGTRTQRETAATLMGVAERNAQTAATLARRAGRFGPRV